MKIRFRRRPFSLTRAFTRLAARARGDLQTYVWTVTVQNQPTTGTDNQAFATQLVVECSDGRGPVAGVTVTASIESGSGSLIGSTTAVTNGSGIATFTTLGINDTAF